MVKAADILRLVLENSKGRAHAPGEVKTPSYDNLNTPDNHKRGSREVKAKSLGDRPARKNVKQVEKPKGMTDQGGPAAPVKMKEARTAGAKTRYGQGNNENQAENAIDDGNDDPRQVQEGIASKDNLAMFGSMARELGFGRAPKPSKKKTNQTKDRPKKPTVKVQEGVVDAVAEFLMNMSGPKVGKKLYDELKAERPDLYQQLVQAFKRMAVGTKGVGMVHDATAFQNMMNDPEAIQLASQLRRWAARKLRNSPEIVAWLQKKAAKLNAKGLSTVDPLGGDEGEEDLRDSVGSPSQYRPGLGESALMGRETIRVVLNMINAGLMNRIQGLADAGALVDMAKQVQANPNNPSRIEPAMQIMRFVRANANRLDPKVQTILNQNVMPKVAESSKTSKTAPGEMSKPAVKTDTPAKSASMRSGSLSPEKKVPARDKKPALNKDAAEFVRVSVKKVQEGVKALEEMGFKVPGLK
jgi:hypothetical protein